MLLPLTKEQLMNEEEYLTAMKRIEELMDAEPGSPEEAELDRLANDVIAYEKLHFPLE